MENLKFKKNDLVYYKYKDRVGFYCVVIRLFPYWEEWKKRG